MHAPNAFRQQLLAAIPRVRRYARTLVFDPALADDLTQTTLERALSHWHQYDQRRDMVVWLLSIAHNAHLDQRRRDGRTTTLQPSELAQAIDRRHPGGDGNLGLRMDLTAALAALGADQRDALLLVSVEQLSYAEAAEVLQVPVGTVMSRVSRARVALRSLLEGGARAAGGTHLKRVV